MIGRIRQYITRRGFRVRTDRGVHGDAAQQAPIDPYATFRPGPGEEWAYRGGCIYLNGEEIEKYLNGESPDVAQWCQILDSLKLYDDWAYATHARQFRALHFAINGIQERVLKQLRNLYHARIGALSLTFGDGEILINNVNVRALLAMYHVRPTAKAKQFLEGMKAKLALILCRHHDNPQVGRVATLVQALYDDLCTSLQRSTIDTPCLPAGPESVDYAGC